MREKDITPKIIELSKEIARYWGMATYLGCWVTEKMDTGSSLFLVYDIGEFKKRGRAFMPIPSVSDCLEKLKKLGYMLELSRYGIAWRITLLITEDNRDVIDIEISSNSLHEALLSALLEVLKGESG